MNHTSAFFSAGFWITAGEGCKLHVKTDESKAELNLALYESFYAEELVETWPMVINVREEERIQLKTTLTASQKILLIC